MKKIGVWVAILMIVAAHSFAQPKPNPVQQAAMKQAEAFVTQRLKDPDSAKFRNLFTLNNPDGSVYAVCGEVNAKNSYGGYNGFNGFVYLLERKTLAFATGTGPTRGAEAALFRAACLK